MLGMMTYNIMRRSRPSRCQLPRMSGCAHGRRKDLRSSCQRWENWHMLLKKIGKTLPCSLGEC
eukprot:12424631-Karenia_brevis.AAC.1